MKKFLILAVLMATLGLAASPVAAATSDTDSPATPTGLTATVMSSNKINLNWNASADDVAVTGYQIFRNGTQIGTSTLISYKNTGLTASTIYTYSVKAYDAAGNISGSSNSVSATSFSTPLNNDQKWQKYYDKKIKQITEKYNQAIKKAAEKYNKDLARLNQKLNSKLNKVNNNNHNGKDKNHENDEK